MRLLSLSSAFLLSFPVLCGADAPSTVSADEALKLLQAGNQRYVDGKLNSVTADELAKRRSELAQGQKPFAIVVCCSDSRVGPEIVFDQELGNIFVVRTAGEVLDAAGIGSIEYAVAHLGSPLLLVLGHEKCGAVAAAVADAKEPGHIDSIIKAIRPAVKRSEGEKGDQLDNAIQANVQDIVAHLKKSKPVLANQVNAGKLKVIGATVSLSTGKASLVSDNGD